MSDSTQSNGPAARTADDRGAIDASCAGPVIAYFASALFWLGAGSLFALVASLKMHLPDWLGGTSWLTFGRVRPAHLNTVTFGWSSMAGIGTAVWMMCRLSRVELRYGKLLIAAPGDPMEVRACLRYLVQHPQPSYLRLGKAGEPSFHAEVPSVEPGRWLAVAEPAREAKGVLLTTGATLASAMDWQREGHYPDHAVRSMPLWGMASKGAQPAQLEGIERLITVEDHLADGGFGSWMCEALGARTHLRQRVESIHLNPDVCGMVGGQRVLNELGGLRPGLAGVA